MTAESIFAKSEKYADIISVKADIEREKFFKSS